MLTGTDSTDKPRETTCDRLCDTHIIMQTSAVETNCKRTFRLRHHAMKSHIILLGALQYFAYVLSTMLPVPSSGVISFHTGLSAAGFGMLGGWVAGWLASN